jgi:hypothetical protein
MTGCKDLVISLLLVSSWWWSHPLDIHHVSSEITLARPRILPLSHRQVVSLPMKVLTARPRVPPPPSLPLLTIESRRMMVAQQPRRRACSIRRGAPIGCAAWPRVYRSLSTRVGSLPPPSALARASLLLLGFPTTSTPGSSRPLIRPKCIHFPEHFCCCYSSNLCVLNTTNTD